MRNIPKDLCLPDSEALRIWDLLPLAGALAGLGQVPYRKHKLGLVAKSLAENRELLGIANGLTQTATDEAGSSAGACSGGGSLAELVRPTKLCLVVVDGMGMKLLESKRAHLPFLRRLLEPSARLIGPVYTTIPSTTASALTSLHTGARSEQTGMLGYECFVPPSADTVNLLKFEGWDAQRVREWCAVPNLYETWTRQGLNVKCVVPERFRDSGMTHITIPAQCFVSAESLSERVSLTIREFRKGADMVYFYWSELDHVGHNQGWKAGAWEAELERIDRAISDLRRVLPADVLIAVCADHGMVDTAQSLTIDIATAPAFAALKDEVVAVAGEPRALHLRLKPHANFDRWQEAFGQQAWLARPEWIWQRSLQENGFDQRIGDFVVFARGNWQFYDSRFQPDKLATLVGVHGSLTPQELLVPFILL